MNKTESIEFGKILKIDINTVDGSLLIRKKFSIFNEENIGSLIFSLLGIFLAGIAISKGSFAIMTIGCLLGGFSIIISSLSILKDKLDFVSVKDGCISMRYNFIKRNLYLIHEDQLTTKSWKEEFRVKRPPFRHVEIRCCRIYFVQNDKTEIPIFNFETNEDNNETALKFVKYLKTEVLNRRMLKRHLPS